MTDLILGIIGETILKFIYGFSNSLIDLFFGVVTTIGNTLPIIVIIVLLYYTVDKSFINHLIYIIIFSAHLNEVFKVFFHNPRPFVYNAEEFQVTTNVLGKKTIWGATGFSFPSGHSQTQGTLWGYVFQKKRNKFLLIIGIMFLISIPLSRIYLGVHWPSDIIVGVLLGALLSWMYLLGDSRYGEKIKKWSDRRKITVGMLLSVGLMLLGLLSFIWGSGLIFNSEISLNDINVWRNIKLGTYSGLIIGIIVGQILEERYIDFSTENLGRAVKLLRIVIGIATAIILYLGARYINGVAEGFQTDMLWITQILNYLSYFAIAVFLAFLIPLFFTKLESKINIS
ncbi:MAG: phosphatase PAP2 family protein [Candidatus Hodarchaeales archaeon]